MLRKSRSAPRQATPATAATQAASAPHRPSALLNTRVIYCGDNLDRLKNSFDGCEKGFTTQR
jgi:hypothetical protein